MQPLADAAAKQAIGPMCRRVAESDLHAGGTARGTGMTAL
ncbi:hypothetical protein XVE_1604 [Xanthomonas vesicatoria ATCC 35937]|uniref:Uncharacterized protein n=1 Tax=Xanthomonas vesicatoria ATCC 35937 TaxID=925775 RepID=F0BBY0_9XANT|nr:hypothetical protein XVE_1604 [Xanthomonas vesicatoria ATCC 35937]